MVPRKITAKMVATRGYIPVKGAIQSHPFTQTLVPVKGKGYRLYVNGPMMKGANVRVGQLASFEIEQNKLKKRDIPTNGMLKRKLAEHGVESAFKNLSPSRQNEINKYLNYLKSEESIIRNIDKVIKGLKGIKPSSLFRLP
jgi:hypothetical protein